MIEIILSGVILVLIVERLYLQAHHIKRVDSLLDRIMSHDYTDYQIGRGIKAEEQVEIPARTDEEEAKMEKERNETLIKTADTLGKDIEAMGI